MKSVTRHATARQSISLCQTCKFAGTCSQISSNLLKIRSQLRSKEDEIVRYYSISLRLEENRFHYPNSSYYCEYAYDGKYRLQQVLDDESILLAMQELGDLSA
ncbi:MAG: hypothetical protein ACOH5I_20900 [Oligoflexus sp.]